MTLNFLDMWSIHHFIIFGFILMFFVNFLKLKVEHKYLALFTFVILWELIERLFALGITFGGFFPTNSETPINIFSDIIVGMAGGFTFMKTGGKFFNERFFATSSTQ